VLFNELKRRKRLLDEAAAKAASNRDAPADALLPGGTETLPEGAVAPPAALSPRRAFAPRAEEAPLPPRASAPSAAVTMTLTASLAAAALAAAPGASGAARVSADNGVIARAREAARERREPSRGRAAARDGDKENSARGAREESAGPHGRAAERAERAERESAREPLGAGAANAANAAAGAAEESERAAALQRRLAADSKRQAIYGQLFGKRPASGGASARGDDPSKEHATAEHSGPPRDAAPVRLNGRRLVAPTVQDLDSSLDSPPHAAPRAVRAQ
jgi:hypothetical protein